MTQELLDLKNYIIGGRYADALSLIDDLEGMSKKAILQAIESFLVRMLIHLIKNQVEQRLTNSWVASIRDSLLKIHKLNLKDNKSAYYISQDEWQSYLDRSFEDAVFAAADEIFEGAYSALQVLEMVDKNQIVVTANHLLNLTYEYSENTLRGAINEALSQLSGGEEWKLGKKNN
jgi:hypothetical protein